MKARIPRNAVPQPANDTIKISKAKLQELMSRELIKAREQIYNEVTTDICRQMLAACLYELHLTYGFREKRLKSVASGACNWTHLAPFGQPITSTDIMNFLAKTYHIDWESIQVDAVDE